jgi:adenine-specific DNA glycosylase
LAGLWQFPDVDITEAEDIDIKLLASQFLSREFDINLEQKVSLLETKSLGSFVHLFTHIKQEVQVEYILLDSAYNLEHYRE